MSTLIKCPPFPELTLSSWNDNGGELRGEGVLHAWAALQTKTPPNLVDDQGDGTFYLTINTPADSNKAPSSEQIAAYEYLLKHDTVIVSAILKSIFDEYEWMREDFAECLSTDDAARLVPIITAPPELLPLISLGTMTIHRVHNENVAYIGMSFGCTWDEEHGIGVLIHRSRIVSVGGCDTSFMEWIPKSDARGDNAT